METLAGDILAGTVSGLITAGNPEIAQVVRPRGGGGWNPCTPTIKDFPPIVKEVDMKYILFVVLFVPVYLVVRWIIRKYWK